MFKKIGENLEISRIENTESCVPAVDPAILDSFGKFASNLKKIAPKAEDFLYFSAVMMHAAEAACLNDDGTPRLTAKGEVVQVGWDKTGGTWKWMSNDPNVRPYKNSNGDIFPEEELTKAYKKWIGKPLCVDHKSSSVEHVRGFIVDTYYDRALKRVIALCALDKAGYPQLARQVSTGVSNCVSMGTAVGRAICTEAGCHRVARTEQDFCDHMKRKTSYGEINVDLNPIELSIVVNGADPKANIKHIIAAAQNLSNYVERKQEQLNKLADSFKANITFTKGQTNELMDDAHGAVTNVEVVSKDLDTFKDDVEKAIEDFKSLQSSIAKEEISTNSSALNQTSDTGELAESAAVSTDSGLAPPHERYASDSNRTTVADGETINNLRQVMASLEDKLGLMKQSLDKLVLNTSIQTQEEHMSGSKEINKKGYYLGTEEPTPGQPKYTKDPLNEKLRDTEDRNMKATDDMGPVDGMYPGDLERKKMLARAESEERAMKRNAVVNMAKQALEEKKAYYLNDPDGKDNPGTPTPGKVKYPADKLNEQLRDKEDKHMNGAKPFPGVGPVDGMYPEDQKKKEMVNRASLRARFVKAANGDGTQNIGKSSWEVFLGDKLLLTASVDELSGGRSEVLYDSIATKEFGSKLIEKVKVHGADKVSSLVKSAQVPPAPPAPEAAPAPEAPAGGEDSGKDGDPKEVALDLAKKMTELASDQLEAVRALTGEQAEMGEAGDAGGDMPEMGATASDQGSRTLNTLRVELNSALTQALKESYAGLASHKEELDMIVRICERSESNAANNEIVGPIFDDALVAAKSAVADGFKLMNAFVKYARGTKAIVKRAEIQAELEALAEGENMTEENDSNSADSDLMSLISETNSDLDALDAAPEEHEHGGHESMEGLEGLLDMPADDNDLMAKPEELKDLQVKPGTNVEVVASLGSREGRSALRAKLAAEALKTSPHLHEAHPKGGFTTELDVKPTGNLAEVEDLEQIHDAMLDLANAPPKVRKEAEAIYRLVSEGKLDPSDLDALVSEGLDKDAVAYYKKFFGQVDGGSEFASELVKEHVKAQMEEELNGYRVKMARAYELAYDMVDRGLCASDRGSVSSQVDEIMKFNNDSFESLKKVVARHAPLLSKTAGRMPQVGMIGSGDVNTSAPSSENLFEQLSAAFAKTSKKMF